MHTHSLIADVPINSSVISFSSLSDQYYPRDYPLSQTIHCMNRYISLYQFTLKLYITNLITHSSLPVHFFEYIKDDPLSVLAGPSGNSNSG